MKKNTLYIITMKEFTNSLEFNSANFQQIGCPQKYHSWIDIDNVEHIANNTMLPM